MIILHHLNNSRSQRILWLLEEIGIPYEIKSYKRDPNTVRAPESLNAIHPLGKSPVITDGDITIAESGAIIDYLIETYGENTFSPVKSSAAYRENVYWMHFAEGSLMPPLLMKLLFTKIKENPMPFFVRPVAKKISDKVMASFVVPEISKTLQFINGYLEGREWFAGEAISGADFQMSFPLEAGVANGTIDDRYPNIMRYVKQFQTRPAYLKALEKGGDYDYGPRNP